MKNTLTGILLSAALASPVAAQQTKADSTKAFNEGVGHVREFLNQNWLKGNAQAVGLGKYVTGHEHTYSIMPKEALQRALYNLHAEPTIQKGVSSSPAREVLVIQGVYDGKRFSTFDLGVNGSVEFAVVTDSAGQRRWAKNYGAEKQFVQQAHYNAVANFNRK